MASFSTRFYFTTSEITKLVVRNLSGVDYTFTQSGVAQQIEGTLGDILTVTATVIDGYKIKSVVNGTVVDKTHFTIPLGTEVFSVNSAEDLPILATPSNVVINGTILTFDEVANATSYEVFVDNVSIGEYVPVLSGYRLSFWGHDEYSWDTDTIAYIKFNGIATSTDYDWKAYTKNLFSYVKDKNGNDVSFPIDLYNITNVNIYLEQGRIQLLSQIFDTIGNHNIVLSTNEENADIRMAAYD